MARIELTEQEKEKFTKELSSILDYMKQLKEIDTSKIEPIKQITGLDSVTREDEIKKNNKQPASPAGRLAISNKLLKEAPSKKGDYFKVPKILE